MSAKGKWDNVLQYCVLMNVIAALCAVLYLFPVGPFYRWDFLLSVMGIATLMGFFALPPAIADIRLAGRRQIGSLELALAISPMFITASTYSSC